MAFSKIVLNNETLMDVTNDTVASDNLLTGYTAHGADGLQVIGTATGGGGVDIPVFTVEVSNMTVTCDKTYQEIYDLQTQEGVNAAYVVMTNSGGRQGDCTAYIYSGTSTSYTYVAFIDGVPFGAFTIYNDDSVVMENSCPSLDTLTVSSSGTFTPAFNKVYNEVIVPALTLPNSASSTSSGTSKATIGRSTSNQYINIPTGFNNTAQYYTVSAVANGTVTAPSTISGTSATVSTGTNTLTLSKTVSVTPSVTTAGYVSSGTAGNSNVSLTASVTTKAAATITPTTTNQTISSGTYLTGTQTISGDANLVAGNIISGKSIFGVNGSVSFITYYTGSSAPSSSLGSNGDIYLKTS